MAVAPYPSQYSNGVLYGSEDDAVDNTENGNMSQGTELGISQDALLKPSRLDPDGNMVERKTSEKKAIRARQNSLRRVNNSTDMLRERSLQKKAAAGQKDEAADGNAAGREGKARQFTVANVGNNGMIYLRSALSMLRCWNASRRLPSSLTLLT